jgi:hypothetical protein
VFTKRRTPSNDKTYSKVIYLWNGVKNILPAEKPIETIGGRPIIPFRKVLDGIWYVCAQNWMPVQDAS